ncbi:MAG: DUF3341 domain-containing protein [Ignavibacteria bacterium]|nr:DUF3341 domain-containing protein [Ignavibacteria bacterium]
MNNKTLYSVSGLFNTPNEIIHASEETVNAGYKKFDVHSPYPLHGMNQAMNLKPSKLGFITLIFGLSGAAFALAFMWWVNVIEYPLVIGGKPLFQLPAFIPVTFEVTVLSAAIFTVVGMLFVMFKFPNNSHPLHDTDYMKKVSADKYGLTIQSIDLQFDENKVTSFLKSLGASEVFSIHYDGEELRTDNKIFNPKFILFLIVTAAVVSGATYFTLNKLLFMSPFNWMVEQDRVNPQSKNEFFADGFGMREPVEGAISRGFTPYKFKGQPENAARYLINSLPMTEINLKIGKEKFEIFCSPCHGNFGKGDSRLKGQFPNPPTLHSEKVRTWSDGAIFHVITDGQNVMPSHAQQISIEERWAVVNYIRVLQSAVNAKESDLK